MKRKIITLAAVAVAVCLFVAFERLELENIKLIGAAVSLYHLKHFCGVVVGLSHKVIKA